MAGMSTSSLLARLEELKKWQVKQQERLLQQQRSRNESTISPTLDNTSNNSPNTSNNSPNPIKTSPEKSSNYDDKRQENRKILSPKDTNHSPIQYYTPQEVVQVSNPNKPKKPFLKRGAGLARFKMHVNDQPKPINRVKTRNRQTQNKENILKVRFEDENAERRDLTPLKVPDFEVKAVWCPVNHDRNSEIMKETISQINEIAVRNINNNCGKYIENTVEDRKQLSVVETNEVLDDRCVENRLETVDDRSVEVVSDNQTKFSELTLKDQVAFLANLREKKDNVVEFEDEIETSDFVIRKKQCFGRNIKNDVVVIQDMRFNSYECFKNFNDKPPQDSNTQEKCTKTPEISDQSLYERNLERDLLIFETLEEKAMNSSFSSTNSSILKILSSTPNKIIEIREKNRQKLAGKRREIITERILEEEIRSFDSTSEGSSVTSEDFCEKTIENDFQSATCDTDTYTEGVASLNTSFSSETSTESRIRYISKGVGTEMSDVSKVTRSAGDVGSKNNNNNNTGDALAGKLKELDEEIQSFRVENAKLQRKKLEFDKNQEMFRKEKKEFEKYVLEEKIKVEFYLEEEKKKFLKEKMIFDKFVKETQNKTNRKEREEISSLKEEIANLKEAAKLKETRNATSQARLRNQIKTQEKEINNLKEEVEKLRKQNAKLTTSQKYNKKTSDTKVLQEINKNLSKLTKDVKIQDQLKKLDELASKDKSTDRSQDKSRDRNRDKSREISPIKITRKSPEKEKERERIEDSILEVKQSSDSYGSYDHFLAEKPEAQREKIVIESPKTLEKKGEFVDEAIVKAYEDLFGGKNVEIKSRISGETQRNTSKSDSTLNDSKMTKTETIQPDGTKEVKYSNGNTKIISPDGNLIRMTYFNGDIKETNLHEGVVKYFYAENQSWHTTEPNGTEILQFQDGQVETKHNDGTHEVRLPNGTVKLTRADKSESITYPDGTKVDISSRGEKIIVLPNGQKEIHTSEHMRREYPDGTVKIVYPDGIQETRYCNGRIRIKDKNGKLLLDSHEENT